MELKDFILFLKKYFKICFVLSVLFSLVVFLVTQKMPTKYRAVGTLYVKRQVSGENPNFFTYEGYHASLTAEKYTDTIIGLLKSPDIKKLAIDNPLYAPSLYTLRGSVDVKRVGFNLVSLSVSGDNPEYARGVWLAMANTVSERFRELNRDGDPKLSIEMVGLTPNVVDIPPKPVLYSFAAFLLIIMVSYLIFSFKDYLKD